MCRCLACQETLPESATVETDGDDPSAWWAAHMQNEEEEAEAALGRSPGSLEAAAQDDQDAAEAYAAEAQAAEMAIEESDGASWLVVPSEDEGDDGKAENELDDLEPENDQPENEIDEREPENDQPENEIDEPDLLAEGEEPGNEIDERDLLAEGEEPDQVPAWLKRDRAAVWSEVLKEKGPEAASSLRWLPAASFTKATHRGSPGRKKRTWWAMKDLVETASTAQKASAEVLGADDSEPLPVGLQAPEKFAHPQSKYEAKAKAMPKRRSSWAPWQKQSWSQSQKQSWSQSQKQPKQSWSQSQKKQSWSQSQQTWSESQKKQSWSESQKKQSGQWRGKPWQSAKASKWQAAKRKRD